VGNIFKRLEGAGAIVIVFEKQPLRLELVEQPATDRLVTSLGQPPAALVSSSDMKAKGHTRKTLHHRVVQIDAEG